MASWTMHLVIAKKILEKINIEDHNAFLIGNVLPDLERWVVTNLDIYVPYVESHYASFYDGEMRINMLNFEQKYGENIWENSLMLGYYVHLFTDDYLNDILRREVTVLDSEKNYAGIKLHSGEVVNIDIEGRKEIKHREYRQFDNELISNISQIPYPIYCESFKQEISKVGIELGIQDIKKVVKEAQKRATVYDKSTEEFEYIMFSKDLLYKRIDDIVECVISKIGERKIDANV